MTWVQRALTTSEGVRLKAKSELDSVQQALAVAREACRKAEEEIRRLTDEQLSLIMELGLSKEEFTAFQAKAIAEMKAMEEEFNTTSDVIFNYGYNYCAFAHDICGSKPMILAEMPNTSEPLPLEFVINSQCPLSAASDPPTTSIIREEPPASSPLVVVDGTDMLPEPPVRMDGEPDVAVDG